MTRWLYIFLIFSQVLTAQIPQTISYQGVLTDNNGNPVADGTYSIKFGLYPDTLHILPLWSETQDIAVNDGIFYAKLGAVDSLNLSFGRPYWLGLSVNGGSELKPEIELTSVPYSINAKNVSGEENVFPSAGSVGIGTNTHTQKLVVNGDIGITGQNKLVLDASGNDEYIYNPDGQNLRISVGGQDRVTIANEGSVGIGTINPQSMLHVNGTIYSAAGGFKFPDGTIQTTAADTGSGSGGSNSLDEAYDEGGSGAGRKITADAGAFEVTGTDGALFGGTYGNGSIPTEGAGTRMMWYPAKGAFRVGGLSTSASSTFWNMDSIGIYSFASGINTRAVGTFSATMGISTIASGSASTAMGRNTTASGVASIAMGTYTTANGSYSTAMGSNTTANGLSSTAMGSNTTASGDYTTAIGTNIEAKGDRSVAVGLSNLLNGFIVSQDNTMAIMGGKVGIGNTAPNADLEVEGTDGVLFGGTFNSGSIPTEGEGVRMMWHPAKGAFRVGRVSRSGSDFWDDDSIGFYSFASGSNTRAIGNSSTAMGSYTTASRYSSTAMGQSSKASGDYSTAMGYGTTASGNFSTAMGRETIASGNSSIAMGLGSEAGNDYSTAIGYNANAKGIGSMALGNGAIVNGDYSTAIGSHINLSGNGAFMIGDNSLFSSLSSTADNRFSARFAGGYFLYSNSSSSIGVQLLSNASSWSAISDSTKKENFKDVDGEDILTKINQFNLGTWNYKCQDKTQFRHYGPMAQDFFNAFGHDGIGTIGNDTTIASADFDGINFIAIQALGKRTVKNGKRGARSEGRISDNEKRIEQGEERVEQTEKRVAKSEERITVLENENKMLKKKLARLEMIIDKLNVAFSDKNNVTPVKDSSLRSE